MKLFELKRLTIKLDFEIGVNNSIKSTIFDEILNKSIDNKT